MTDKPRQAQSKPQGNITNIINNNNINNFIISSEPTKVPPELLSGVGRVKTVPSNVGILKGQRV